jgi:histidinol-phosphatase (PHP family)
MTPIDGHVHTEWSWDAARGSLEGSCRKALELGLPAIAFTDHADFVTIHNGQRRLDVAGYLEAIERCRALFPDLRILSGVELGEPHWFPEEAAEVLAAGGLERILGSVHCIEVEGRPADLSRRGLLTPETAPGFMRAYLAETLAMIESDPGFEILAHIDYPKRYWPHTDRPFFENEFEEEYRDVLHAAARRGCVLEVNTTRGGEPHRALCPGLPVLRWWWEAGGTAVSFGSDAHEPSKIAAGFELAAKIVEAVGFKPAPEPTAFWRR